jgi:flavodoxin II
LRGGYSSTITARCKRQIPSNLCFLSGPCRFVEHNADTVLAMTHKKPIGLFYGSSTCYTEMAAEKIQRQFGQDELGQIKVDLHNISDTPLITSQFYDYLIMGIPTWDYGELQEDWEEAWDDIEELDLHGKKVALFGLGDQIGYPEWFLDAMGYLFHKLVKRGATLVGFWPTQGFNFEASKALTDDESQFVGLALDDENQFDLTDQRIEQWCKQLHREFNV